MRHETESIDQWTERNINELDYDGRGVAIKNGCMILEKLDYKDHGGVETSLVEISRQEGEAPEEVEVVIGEGMNECMASIIKGEDYESKVYNIAGKEKLRVG